MTRIICWALVIVVTPLVSWAQSVQGTPRIADTSYVVGGERVLRQEVIVRGALKDVWEAFTTAKGLRTFAVPVVELELKTGGKFHSHYRPGSKVGDPGTIYNTVLAYVPQKMLAFRIGLTMDFPEGPRQAQTLFTVVDFESTGPDSTKVTESMIGWGSGKDWDEVYRFFTRGNAYTLGKLQTRFLSGPVEWPKEENEIKALEQR